MPFPLCDDGGHTTQPWDEEYLLEVEDAIHDALHRSSNIYGHLSTVVDLRWPGLLPLVLLGGHPLRLKLVHGQFHEPIPVGPDVLGVDIEENIPWQAVLALEPATGPGGCAVLLSDCVTESHESCCPWPSRDLWQMGLYQELVGEVGQGFSWEVAIRLPCRGLESRELKGWTQPGASCAEEEPCVPSFRIASSPSAPPTPGR